MKNYEIIVMLLSRDISNELDQYEILKPKDDAVNL